MSFLDNLKKKENGASLTPIPKVNPLAAKATVAVPNPLAKKTETAVNDSKAEVSNKAPKKMSPFLIKKDNVAAVPAASATNPFLKKTIKTEKAKTEEVKTGEVKVETANVETKAETPTKDIVADIKESDKETKVIAEEKAETKKSDVTSAPIKGKGSRKSAANTAKNKPEPEVKDDMNEASAEAISMPTTEITYVEAMEYIASPFVDAEWESYKEEIQKDLDDIQIDDDMNPATLKSTVGKLSRLRNKVWNNYQGMKSQYEAMSSKEPEGLIERVKKISLAGNNDLERKKAGVEACMNYTDKSGKNINLYEVLDETRSRYNFLKTVMDSIEYKRSVLVTMNGALKIEQSLGPES
jgi:hypothetical protein